MPDVDKLLNAIDEFEANSYGADDNGDLSSERALSIRYYRGENVEPAPEGRSQVVDRSVYETIQWMLPSLCRIFASGDNVVEFEPLGPDDEEAAEQESDYLNYLVTQKNDWFSFILSWFQDALLSRNAYAMGFIDKRVSTEVERYENQSAEAVALLLDDKNVEVVGQEEFPDEESDPEMMMDPMGQPVIDELGQPVMAPKMLYNIELRRTRSDKKLCLKVLPPERVKVSERTPDHTLTECEYFEYWENVSISELRAMGFEVDDDIASDVDTDTEEDEARDVYSEEGEINPIDPSLRRVKARTVWVRHDYNEDGIAEMQRCVIVGRQLLDRREESRIPVVSIVPNPLTHRHIGLSVADVVMDVQRIKTAILRQGLDNLYLSNNQRQFVVSDKVNLDDVLISRPGGVIRGKPGAIYGQDYMPIPQPFVFPQAVQGLEYMDRVRETRTGTNLMFQGVDPNAMQNTATGISQLSSMAAQRVEQVARVFAPGVKELFSICHELVLKHGHKSDTIKLRGQWVDVDPATWRTGRDLRIAVSFGAGNKDAMLSRIIMILQAQREAIQIGVAQPDDIYEALLEMAKLADFSTPEKFFTDPKTLQPAPPKPDPLEVTAQIESAKIQQNAQESEQKSQLEQMKAQIAAEAADKDRALKKYIADLEAEVKIIINRENAGNAINLEEFRARAQMPVPDPSEIEEREMVTDVMESQKAVIADLSQRLVEAVEMTSAPRELIRDKRGRVTGVKINGVTRPISRDANGRVVGLQ